MLDSLAKSGAAGTAAGRATALHEVCIALRRNQTSWLFASVENAIVHGTVRDHGAEPIVLRTQVEGGRLRLSISNPTASVAPSEDGKGFGLRYVKERLNQFYGSDAHFSFGVDDRSAVATLDIPYTTEARGTA